MNLKQLAAHLNLSQTTVSRALNGYPEVRDATRERVIAAAKAMHYNPDARAKGLATGRSMAIAHVIRISTRHEMVNPIFGDFITGASETYVKAGFDMLLSLVADADEDAFYRRIKARGSVDGVIVHGPRMQDRRIALLRELGLPFVVHGRASEVTAPYAWLDVNNTRAFQRATALLIELGHRRIGLVNGLEVMDFADRRREGYRAALAAAGMDIDTDLMRSGEMTEVQGHSAAREMLALAHPPTAFLTSSMVTAIGVRRAVQEAGLTLGRDVSVITHDDALSYLRNGQDVPLFTAVRSSVREAGQRAAAMLLQMIATPEAPLPTQLMEAELILGQSTGPAPTD